MDVRSIQVQLRSGIQGKTGNGPIVVRGMGPPTSGPHTSRTGLGVLTAQNHVVSYGRTESNEAQEAYHCPISLRQAFLCLPDGPRTSGQPSCTSFPWPTTPSLAPEAGPPTASTPASDWQPTTTTTPSHKGHMDQFFPSAEF